MKRFIVGTLLLFSVSAFAGPSLVMDTISYWKVFIGGKLFKEYDVNSQDLKFILPKGKIRASQTLSFRYTDDTPCSSWLWNYGCKESLTIKNSKGETIRVFDDKNSDDQLEITTTELQLLAFKNKDSILRFYYREEDSDEGFFVFEIEIR